MKRSTPRKNRDRRTGQSPYFRHKKAPYQYSTGYYSWRAQYVKGGRTGPTPELKRRVIERKN